MRMMQNPAVRSPAILRIRRSEVEARIEELIALLDLLDGDENLEPYLAGTYPEDQDREHEEEREPEDEEANGDELDGCRAEDEWRPVPQRRRRRA